MYKLPIRLDCVECREFQEWEKGGNGTIKCEECGKRHSGDSLYTIFPDKEYERNDEGALLGVPP